MQGLSYTKLCHCEERNNRTEATPPCTFALYSLPLLPSSHTTHYHNIITKQLKNNSLTTVVLT
jgi:hypothetical protein